ncbi:MAG TPA: tRNA (guanine-N7)-methyltransferase, partial [Nocardioides sp.]|nr:tRNA (guanine-N7)-methyltransferase [Nocardioides sp.]
MNDEQHPAGGVRPARPHHKLTEDGRRVREVLTYARRGSRFTPKQQAAWDEYAERWVVPDEAVDEPGFSWTDWFGREAPLIVEIGGGVGEATAALAAARPSYNILALEV